MAQNSIGNSATSEVKKSPEKRKALRVVHVSSAHPWTDIRVHYREASSLADAGYQVHLVAVENDLRSPAGDVVVHRLRRRSRLLRVLVGTVSALAAGLGTGAKLFHLHDPELAWAIPLLRAAGKIVVYDAHEDLPSQMLDKLYVPRRLRRSASRLARLLVAYTSLANHVVAATDRIAQRYPAARVTVIRNYPIERESDSKSTPLGDRSKAVVYVGAISESRGALQMLDALAHESFPEGWTLHLAGNIVPSSLLTRLKTHPAWHRVVYHGVTSPDDARNVIGNARVGLVALQRNAAYVDSLPTKMFEYMAAGIPVVASDFPLWKDIVVGNACGVLVDESSGDAIAAAVARYASDEDLMKEHGANSLAASKSSLNWTAEAGRLVDLYDRLLET